MDRHLVTIKVSVISFADQRVQPDGLPINKDRFKCLNPKSMQGRCTVQQHWTFLDDIFKHVPNIIILAINLATSIFDVASHVALNQFAHHKWLEQFQCHFTWYTALIELQPWADINNGTAGVIDTLTKQVLTEPALLPFQHV